jgi:hypothetical protein
MDRWVALWCHLGMIAVVVAMVSMSAASLVSLCLGLWARRRAPRRDATADTVGRSSLRGRRWRRPVSA